MAAVQFTAAQLHDLIYNYIGEPEPGVVEEAMQVFAAATHNSRSHREAMQLADDLIEGHGVEHLYLRDGQVVTDGWDSTFLADYVNVGDSYSPTIIYDYPNRAFRIGSYGDIVESHDNERVRVEELTAEDDLHDDDAEESERLSPTWDPESSNAILVAWLRAVEGHLLAVHYMPDGEYMLAFSVSQTEDHLLAASEGEPYLLAWPTLVERFSSGENQVYVAGYGTNIDTHRTVSIEREMFSRLQVAMDRFFEVGMEYQPMKTMLDAPPVLFTERDVVGCVWSEEERGGDAAVECYANANSDRDEDVAPGADLGDLSLWSARGAELEEMIEDGMFRWKNDRDVSRFLREQVGILR